MCLVDPRGTLLFAAAAGLAACGEPAARVTLVNTSGGGVVAAVGKSAPLDFRALPDGASIPVFMAPLEDFCPAADMRAARVAPLVARTRTGRQVW
jgi:hypothetical protein